MGMGDAIERHGIPLPLPVLYACNTATAAEVADLRERFAIAERERFIAEMRDQRAELAAAEWEAAHAAPRDGRVRA